MPRGAGPQVPRGRRAAAADEHAGIPVGPGEVARGSAEVPGPRVRVGVPRREERCPEPLDHGTLHDIVATRKARRERRVGGAGAAADGGPAPSFWVGKFSILVAAGKFSATRTFVGPH